MTKRPAQKEKMHPQDQRNLMIFAVVFAVIYLSFDAFYLQPHMQEVRDYNERKAAEETALNPELAQPENVPRPEALETSERITLSHESFSGSINLLGGVIDDVVLTNYFETLEKKERVAVLSPAGTQFPRSAGVGWLGAENENARLPDYKTEWTLKQQTEQGAILEWRNGQGLRFEKEFSITDDYLIKVTQRVFNETNRTVTLFPYALITEHGLPEKLIDRWLVHEGPIGFINSLLEERDYDSMSGDGSDKIEAARGWIGFTEQYWLTAILPEQNIDQTYRFVQKRPTHEGGDPRFQVDVISNDRVIEPGRVGEHTVHIFAGAKELLTLQRYGRELDVSGFDQAIDFGWFWFLTKPFFQVMMFINGYIGYFAGTILVFAFLLRLAVFPLANTSFRSFAKLKVITPKIMELRERYADDKPKLQAELVELYKREKVNPAAGCLPILIQIPIFFSLFKVLNVAIEMRHAPGFFWIDDLSAPDPTSIFNLFGALPYEVPAILVIGAWPCLMMLTLMIQQSMNPPPTDETMKTMFRIMPFFLAFIMSGFAAGLVFYFTFSNMLSIAQQYMINRMMGVRVKFFQGWFGRETQESSIDQASEYFRKQMGIEAPEEKKSDDKGEVPAEDVAESEAIKNITPPKPKKSKKKK